MDEQEVDRQDVPPALRRLWGRPERPRRGPKPSLSAERIVVAATELADAEGLAAVSMARVAESLGYTAMALYRHVESKDELLALLADRFAADLEMPEHAGDWRSGLEAWTRTQIDAVLARPWFLDLPLATLQPGPHRMRWLEEAFAVLREVRLTGEEKLAVIGLLAQHVLAEARVQIETDRAATANLRHARGLPADTAQVTLDSAELAMANPMHDFDTVLRHLAAPGEFPELTAALAGVDASPSTLDPRDGEIDFGLGIVLDGVEVFVRGRTG